MCHNYSSPIDFCCRDQLYSSNRNKFIISLLPSSNALHISTNNSFLHLFCLNFGSDFIPQTPNFGQKRKENLVSWFQTQLFIYQGNQLHVFSSQNIAIIRLITKRKREKVRGCMDLRCRILQHKVIWYIYTLCLRNRNLEK